MTVIGTIIDNKYEILKQIGKGGMSIVYLAMDLRLNKQWAIKEILKTDSITDKGKADVIFNSLLIEANLMKKLDHPALPRIVDIIDDGVTIYIVMDYIEGESLDKVIRDYGPQSESVVLDWAKQLANALQYLHTQTPPIIYRDMKPANVMLKPDGTVKVIDFGIAREYKSDSFTDTTILGTKGYAPPEQHGRRQTDNRSDIYALGMTMHHLLTGLDPRNRSYEYHSVKSINSELSDGIDMIINKCTALNPLDRYQNCIELLYDLAHPDLITKGYKKQQKYKLKLFMISSVVSILCLLVSLVSLIFGNIQQSHQYDNLVNVLPSVSKQDKMNSYQKAIEIYPDNPKAYIKLLEMYEDEGVFDKADSDFFLALYNAHRDKFSKNDKVAQLNYKAGQLYLNYYTQDKAVNFNERVQKSFPFFERNKVMEIDYADQKLSDFYYEITTFYRKYVFTSAKVVEASTQDYQDLIEKMTTLIDSSHEISAYDRLLLFNSMYAVIYDQRNLLPRMHIAKDTIENILNYIYDQTIQTQTQKALTRQLKEDILSRFLKMKESILRTYQVEKRGQ